MVPHQQEDTGPVKQDTEHSNSAQPLEGTSTHHAVRGASVQASRQSAVLACRTEVRSACLRELWELHEERLQKHSQRYTGPGRGIRKTLAHVT